jgi:hypothetical protein
MNLDTPPSTHFARVLPIVGASLQQAQVALIGLPRAAPIVTHLAASGVGRWLWASPADGSDARLQSYLRAQHGPALTLDVTSLPLAEWTAAIRTSSPDLLIAMGGALEQGGALKAIAETRVPALLITPPTDASPCQATVVLPGDPPPGELARPDPTPDQINMWGWATSAPLCAGLARAILLRDTPWRRTDLGELWHTGVRVLTLGDDTDPFAVCPSRLGQAATCEYAAPPFRTPPARRGTLLIVGLGSLGSIAAMHLTPYAANMVIADPDQVDAYNPVRQAYPLAAVGQPKARALREELLAAGAENVKSMEKALSEEQEVTALVTHYNVTAALVVTGTEADFAIARALRENNVPHVVARCYPRARYWEAIIVDGQRGPAFDDLRGHLSMGPTPPPTPEQNAAYSQAGALEAEPATLIESGWAAAWLARLTAQMVAPPGLRERWLLELLASERTCIIGGGGVEPTPDGPAYGITLPGVIHAWGREQIRST